MLALIDVSLSFALTAGMVAAFNPCGFAMLPAYLSWFVSDDRAAGSSRAVAVARALVVAGAMTAGFVIVFGVFGLLIEGVSSAVEDITKYLTVVIGALLVPVGVFMLLGREIKVKLPRMQRGGDSRGTGSMVLFGMSYATVSLSCTLPVFLAAVSGSFSDVGGVVGGIATYVAYSLGMGLVIVTLTVAIALARDGLVRRLRSVLPYINRVSGALLVLAGLYVTYYGYWEIRLLRGDDVPEGPVAWVSDWSAQATERVDDIGPWVIVAILVVLLAAGLLRRRGRGRVRCSV